MQRQPRCALTRSMIICAECWASSANAPSTRSTSVASAGGRVGIAPQRSRPLDFDRAAPAGHTRAGDLAPVGHQAGLAETLARQRRLDKRAEERAERRGVAATPPIRQFRHWPRSPMVGAMPPSLSLPRPDAKPHDASRRVLEWWDRQRRTLPWRAEPGERVDPYRVWLSEILLQQTTDNGGGAVFRALHRALAARRRPRRRPAGRRHARLRRARLLFAGAQHARLRARGCAARRRLSRKRGRIARPARHRRLYGRGDRGDRVRPTRFAGRRQYRAHHDAPRRHRRADRQSPPRHRRRRGGFDARRSAGRLRAGADGYWRDDLHAAQPGLPRLSVAAGLRRRGDRTSRRPIPARRRAKRARSAAARLSSRRPPTAAFSCALARPRGCSAARWNCRARHGRVDFAPDEAASGAPFAAPLASGAGRRGAGLHPFFASSECLCRPPFGTAAGVRGLLLGRRSRRSTAWRCRA